MVPLGWFATCSDSIFRVSRILAVGQMLGEEWKMLAVDIARVMGDFFDAGNLVALTHLDS